jgi:hypothetical protein
MTKGLMQGDERLYAHMDFHGAALDAFRRFEDDMRQIAARLEAEAKRERMQGRRVRGR